MDGAHKLTKASDWNKPYTFFNSVYKIDDGTGNEITGPLGTLLGVW